MRHAGGVDVSTDDLSAFLTRAWNNARDAANTLPDQLEIEQQAALTLIATGSIASVGKNSAHQSFGNYNPGNLTQRQITSIYTQLKRAYFRLKDIITDKFNAAQIAIGSFDFDVPIYQALIRAPEMIVSLAASPVERPSIINLNLPVRHDGEFCGYPSQPEVCAQ